MSYRIEFITAEEWGSLSEHAHFASFGETRSSTHDRISRAALAFSEDKIIAYTTMKEIDSETAYIQFGGTFPAVKNPYAVVKCYEKFIAELEKEYKYLYTFVNSNNIASIRLNLHAGFRVSGFKVFKDSKLVELSKIGEN